MYDESNPSGPVVLSIKYFFVVPTVTYFIDLICHSSIFLTDCETILCFTEFIEILDFIDIET